MSRYCGKHLPERTTEEVTAYGKEARAKLAGTDPRTKEGQALVKRLNRCNEVLRQREAAEV